MSPEVPYWSHRPCLKSRLIGGNRDPCRVAVHRSVADFSRYQPTPNFTDQQRNSIRKGELIVLNPCTALRAEEDPVYYNIRLAMEHVPWQQGADGGDMDSGSSRLSARGEDEDGLPLDDLPACVSCRRRKSKCSRERPSCSQCIRLSEYPANDQYVLGQLR